MGSSGPFGVAFLSVLVVLSVVDLSSAEIYRVGDSAGWTIMGNPNYTAWTFTKTFNVGDTLLFVYHNQFHNVMEVDRADYRACNASSPRKTYTSGNDSIAITRKGHYYFLCGIPGHCIIGQKVDIRIPKSASPFASPSVSPPSGTIAPAPAPAPGSHSSSASRHTGVGMISAVTTFLMFGLV